jgi:hypothetical protein
VAGSSILKTIIQDTYTVQKYCPKVKVNAYLVGCHEGFFLFSDDLLEGRMVARNWQDCIQNLRAHPVEYEGREILKAASTPSPDDVPMTGLGHATMNGGENIPSVNGIGHTQQH